MKNKKKARVVALFMVMLLLASSVFAVISRAEDADVLQAVVEEYKTRNNNMVLQSNGAIDINSINDVNAGMLFTIISEIDGASAVITEILADTMNKGITDVTFTSNSLKYKFENKDYSITSDGKLGPTEITVKDFWKVLVNKAQESLDSSVSNSVGSILTKDTIKRAKEAMLKELKEQVKSEVGNLNDTTINSTNIIPSYAFATGIMVLARDGDATTLKSISTILTGEENKLDTKAKVFDNLKNRILKEAKVTTTNSSTPTSNTGTEADGTDSRRIVTVNTTVFGKKWTFDAYRVLQAIAGDTSTPDKNFLAYNDESYSKNSEGLPWLDMQRQVESVKKLQEANKQATDGGLLAWETAYERMRYYYNGFQTNKDSGGEGDLLMESVTQGDSVVPMTGALTGGLYVNDLGKGYSQPIKLVSTKRFMKFLDVANEIPTFAYYLSTKFKGLTDEQMMETNKVLSSDLGMLKTIHDMVIFLAQVEDSNSPSFKFLTDCFYSKVGDADKTLEDYYNRFMDLGMLEGLLVNKLKQGKSALSTYIDVSAAGKNAINGNILKGIAQSSKFLPLQTNVYDPTTYKSLKDDAEFMKFHMAWGFHRKALFIDKSNSSVVDSAVTGKTGTARLATLNDLLQVDRDISLYADDNFYNIKKLSDIVDKAWDRVSNNGQQSAKDKNLWDNIVEFFTVDLAELTKTAEYTTYTENPVLALTMGDTVLKDEASKKLIDYDDKDYSTTYSPLKALAVVSCVLLDPETRAYLNANTGRAILRSSKNIIGIQDAPEKAKLAYLNYVYLKNIVDASPVNYKNSLDRNSPIYVDIYGNIVTESGFIVVPSATNTTYMNNWNPYTTGFLSTYGTSYLAPNDSKYLDKFPNVFSQDTAAELYKISPRKRGLVNLTNLSTQSEDVAAQLYGMTTLSLSKNDYDVEKLIPLVVEVMRGAPLESINKKEENLNPGVDVSRLGIAQAIKFEDFKSSIEGKGGSELASAPNIAYMKNFEFIIFMIYKIGVMIAIPLMLLQIVVSTITETGGLRQIVGLIFTTALIIVSAVALPFIYDLSYYSTNRVLLQNEALYMATLNYEKKEAGVEIGLLDVKAPSTGSKFLLKVEDIDVPWYTLFKDIMWRSIDSNLTAIYNEHANKSLAIGQKGFQQLAGGMYMDVSDLLDSSAVVLEAKTNTIYQYTKSEIPASHYTPYYVILDSLIKDINTYNSENDVYSYGATTYANGKVKSLGMVKAYFLSDNFMLDDGADVTGLRDVYQVETGFQKENRWTQDELSSMYKSQWCDPKQDKAEIKKRTDILEKSARKFISDNMSLIGKVSDETFLKMMSLTLSLKHNEIFNIGSMSSLEIQKMATDDIVRLAFAPRDEVMRGSPYSFSKFVFETGGTTAVYAAGILYSLLFLISWVRPIFTLLVFIIAFFSIFVFKLIFRRKDFTITGALTASGLLITTNVIYGVMLKLSLHLPNAGIPPTLCLILQIFLNALFIFVMMQISVILLKNWNGLDGINILTEIRNSIQWMGNFSKTGKITPGTSKGWEDYNKKIEKDKRKPNAYRVISEKDI